MRARGRTCARTRAAGARHGAGQDGVELGTRARRRRLHRCDRARAARRAHRRAGVGICARRADLDRRAHRQTGRRVHRDRDGERCRGPDPRPARGAQHERRLPRIRRPTRLRDRGRDRSEMPRWPSYRASSLKTTSPASDCWLTCERIHPNRSLRSQARRRLCFPHESRTAVRMIKASCSAAAWAPASPHPPGCSPHSA